MGLIGWPITRSLSVAMHTAAFAAHGLAEAYALWPTPADELAARIAALREPGMRGANITIPHKIAALALVDEVDATAQQIGAINTIVRRHDGSLWGTNTDGPGFLAALAEAGCAPHGQAAVVLGAGGAARAVVWSLAQAGAASITLINRTLAHAETLCAELHEALPGDPPPLMALAADDPDGAALISAATLLVNATSVGSDDVALPLAATALHARLCVVDLIYRDTPLLRAARAVGAQAEDGLEMLVQQGALAFAAWTGLAAPIAEMRAAALQARG